VFEAADKAIKDKDADKKDAEQTPEIVKEIQNVMQRFTNLFQQKPKQ
jgi:hypothetical protein